MHSLDTERNDAPIRVCAPAGTIFARRIEWGFDPDPDAPMNAEERRVLSEAIALLRKALVKR